MALTCHPTLLWRLATICERVSLIDKPDASAPGSEAPKKLHVNCIVNLADVKKTERAVRTEAHREPPWVGFAPVTFVIELFILPGKHTRHRVMRVEAAGAHPLANLLTFLNEPRIVLKETVNKIASHLWSAFICGANPALASDALEMGGARRLPAHDSVRNDSVFHLRTARPATPCVPRPFCGLCASA